MSGLPPPPPDLPPPGWPATEPEGAPPPWPIENRYAAPVPAPGGGRKGLLIAAAGALGVAIGVLLTIAVVASLDDDAATSTAAEEATPTEGATPTVTSIPELPELEPLEHEFDLYGPTGTCVAAGTFANVSCDEDHAGEVFARLAVPGTTFPGPDALQADFAARCDHELLTLTDESPAEAGLAVIGSQPSAEAWDNGLHDVVCIAMSFGGAPNVGSIADGG